MLDIYKVMCKRTWFLIFNCVTIIYLIGSGTLKWDLVSIVSCGAALLLINCMAMISSRKYRDWK